MGRHKCIICGKVRLSQYIEKRIDLNGDLLNVCKRSVSYESNYIKIHDFYYNIHPCIIKFHQQQHNNMVRLLENYERSKKMFPYYDKILQEQNVTPELTFLLQL